MISASSRSRGLYLASCILLSIGACPASAVDEGGTAAGLFRIEDGAVVIDWSPGVEFGLDSPGAGENLTAAGMGMENHGLNATLGAAPQAGEGSSDWGGSAPLSPGVVGAYAGLSGAHLGWASGGLQAGGTGRPAEYGRRVTDIVGIFSIDMTIKLGSNSSSPGSGEWIGCP